MKRLWFSWFLAFTLFTILLHGSSPMAAQAVFGRIVGTVMDASGAAVPNAQVLIKDIDRSTEYRTNSGGQGDYAQGQLLAGSYSVTVSATGFGNFTSTVQV